MQACSGPYVHREDRGQYLHGRYRTVVVLPFEVRGELSEEEAGLLEGWVEQDLTTLKLKVQPADDLQQAIQDRGADTEEEKRRALLEACQALGIRGIWNARAEMSAEDDGRFHMTLVLRLTSVKTGEWVTQLDGHDRVDPKEEGAGPLWKAWRDLVRAVVAQLGDEG